MRYLGGKKRLAKRIAAVLDAHRSDGQLFIDMFCGSLVVSAAMPNRGHAIANDGCIPLINMYQAWRGGWRPPEHVSEELYAQLKAKQDPNDPLTAFAGFGLAYGGIWFNTYARSWTMPGCWGDVPKRRPGSIPQNYARVSARALEVKLGPIDHVTLTCSDFQAFPMVTPSSALVYFDPPYRGTTRYSYFKAFDHDAFEAYAQQWADNGATVFVSEYAKHCATWEQVAEWTTSKNIAKAPRTERLFRVHPT